MPLPCPRGDELMQRATKRLSQGFFRELLTPDNKYEAAAEMYTKAAMQYKLSHDWIRGALAHESAAKIYQENLSDDLSTCTAWQNAARAYRCIVPAEAVRCHVLAARLHMEHGRFRAAATHWSECALAQEKQGLLSDALVSYTQSAHCFEADNGGSRLRAAEVRIKIASIYMSTKAYGKAARIYENLARDEEEEGGVGSRFRIATFRFEALLCRMADGAAAAFIAEQLELAIHASQHFEGSRQHTLVQRLFDATNERDPDAFTLAIAEYNAISPLDSFHITMLLDMKLAIERDDDNENQVPV